MPLNFRRFFQDVVAEGYFKKAMEYPQWRRYASEQINYLSQFFPSQADIFMADEEEKIPLVFPPPGP
jgi:hypothetical protein